MKASVKSSVTPNTSVAEPHQALRLKGLMEKLAANPDSKFLDCHEVRLAPGVALLVEPINGAPYVFVLPDSLTTFDSKPGSGTDRLRARIEASLYFERILDEHAPDDLADAEACSAPRSRPVERLS